MTWRRMDIFPSQDGAVRLKVTANLSIVLAHLLDSTVFGCFLCTGLASLLPNLSLIISYFLKILWRCFKFSVCDHLLLLHRTTREVGLVVSMRMLYVQSPWCVAPAHGWPEEGHSVSRLLPFSRLTVCCLGRSAVGSGRSLTCWGETVLVRLLWRTAPHFLLTH